MRRINELFLSKILIQSFKESIYSNMKFNCYELVAFDEIFKKKCSFFKT